MDKRLEDVLKNIDACFEGCEDNDQKAATKVLKELVTIIAGFQNSLISLVGGVGDCLEADSFSKKRDNFKKLTDKMYTVNVNVSKLQLFIENIRCAINNREV